MKQEDDEDAIQSNSGADKQETPHLEPGMVTGFKVSPSVKKSRLNPQITQFLHYMVKTERTEAKHIFFYPL